MPWALVFAPDRAGSSMEASTAMMAITTRSSISVNPRLGNKPEGIWAGTIDNFALPFGIGIKRDDRFFSLSRFILIVPDHPRQRRSGNGPATVIRRPQLTYHFAIR